MKIITPSLVRFGIAASFFTIIFRYFLSYGIENRSTIIVALTAFMYFFSMWISGWVFGKKDGEYLPINDVGFRFHFATYLIHNSISILWIALGYGSSYEKLSVSLTVAFYWGIFLLLHCFFYLWARKNSIDDLDKEDLFE